MFDYRGRVVTIGFIAALALAIPHDAATQEGPSARQQILYSFRGRSDGANPLGRLIVDARGALFGATVYCGRGWRDSCPGSGGPAGLGIVFKLTPTSSGYAESVLYRFTGRRDGANPSVGLVADSSGALYGTTVFGGGFGPSGGSGTAFKLIPTGSAYAESVIHRFEGESDGARPAAALIIDRAGALYGTTWLGGSLTCTIFNFRGCGTVFKLTPSGSRYASNILYRFTGGSDGIGPFGRLIADRSGALYGTTNYGGGSACDGGCGTVFKLTPRGSGYGESILYRFQGGTDGAHPVAGLVFDKSGALYGTTESGGSSACGVYGCGTVFKLAPGLIGGYGERILYRFQGGSDGYYPEAELIADETGALYGTTIFGGSSSLSGTVFKLTPAGSAYAETVVYRFKGLQDGAFPESGLIARGRALYGTTSSGGRSCQCGTVFKLTL
jgi:uncharacterized repeat protein (TIGR03803 family)